MNNVAKSENLKTEYPPKKCKCGNLIYAHYIEPVYIDFLNRNMKGTGIYTYADICKKCREKKDEEFRRLDNIQFEKEQKELKENKRKERLNSAGFLPKHVEILKQNMSFSKDLQDINLDDNLFIFGNTGTGKTSFAVKRLFKQINSGKTGKIKIFPEMILELRKAVKNKNDSDVLNSLTDLDCLVIDDFGVGRFTEYVLELVYMIIERWYSGLKTGLTITCNKSLDDIAKLDDRFSSRITAMCKIVKLEGSDYRLRR